MQDESLTAFHEAAHVVAAHVLGRPRVRYASSRGLGSAAVAERDTVADLEPAVGAAAHAGSVAFADAVRISPHFQPFGILRLACQSSCRRVQVGQREPSCVVRN